MKKLDVINQIQKNAELLSLPQAISELLTEMEKQNFSPEMLSTIVLKDPALTSRILKMANSSYYQRFGEIRTVNQAVQVLGLTSVKMMALSSSILNPKGLEKNSGINTKEFFANVLKTAAASERIARAVGHKAPEEAFIAGLLHDIGILLFLQLYPNEYGKIIRKEVRVRLLTDAERAVFETDHAEVGYHLALKWHLPAQLAEAIRDHHSYHSGEAKNQLVTIIQLATLLTEGGFLDYNLDLESRLQAVSQAAKRLGLAKERVDKISSSITSDAVRVAEYMGLDIGDMNDMLVRANKELWQAYLLMEKLFTERQDLSAKLLNEERAKGAVEAKNIAMATLSHYVNNAAMAIYGRTQLLTKHLSEGEHERVLKNLPASVQVMEQSILKITAVLAEIKEISPIDDIEFYDMSQAMKVDDRIERRMKQMQDEPVIQPAGT